MSLIYDNRPRYQTNLIINPGTENQIVFNDIRMLGMKEMTRHPNDDADGYPTLYVFEFAYKLTHIIIDEVETFSICRHLIPGEYESNT